MRFSTLLLPLPLLGCVASEPFQPAPTENPRDHDESMQRQSDRERWIEEMHRTAPGVDWRAIERRNQEAQLDKRNRMASGMLPAGSHSWEEVGSRNQAGHTRCAALGASRSGERFLYVGSAGGGTWRSPDDGSDWQPISDSIHGGVDELVVLEPANLNDEDIVLQRQGTSIHRSDDGGLTWFTPSGLAGISEIHRMLVLPDAGQTILLYGRDGTLGELWASVDEGQSFQQRWTGIQQGEGDIWAPQFGTGAGTHVYLLHRGDVYRSTDSGNSFSLRGTVVGNMNRGSLVGSEAGAPHLYCAIDNGGWTIHRSDDAGLTWTSQGAPPQYWGSMTSLAASSIDPDAIFTGGVQGYRSFNGGSSWDLVNTWGSYYSSPHNRLHADLRGLSPIPDPDQLGVADRLYINTDGGTYLSTNQGVTVQNLCLQGMGVGQFYGTHTSTDNPNRIVGGTQDQGYQRGIRQPWTGGPSTDFDQLISGDYGHLVSGDGDHDYVFSTYPGFILIQIGETNPSLELEDFPTGSNHLWLPPVVADPLDQNDCFFLGDRLWHYEGSGNSWTYSQHSNQTFGANLAAMAFAPTDPMRAYAVSTQGHLWWSDDRGVTWTASASTGPGSHYFHGSGMEVHPTDADRAVVSGSGYSTAGVRMTTDGGLTWAPLNGGLPNTMIYDICWANDGTDDLYAATETGPYRFDSITWGWIDISGNEAPSTTYWSVESVPTDNRIRFATYGRGIWDYLLDPNAPTVLYTDNFESGNFTAGGWTVSNSARCKIKQHSAFSGTYGAKLKKGGVGTGACTVGTSETWMISPSFSTLNYSIIELSMDAHFRQQEIGCEYMDCQYSINGGAWVSFAQIDQHSWAHYDIPMPLAVGGQSDVRLRFITNAKGKNERAEVDNLVITGI